MIKLYTCLIICAKEKIDQEVKNPQSPFNIWGGWIGAKLSYGYAVVYYYRKFPVKTYNLHFYLRKIKKGSKL
jgi:hypothetical protein